MRRVTCKPKLRNDDIGITVEIEEKEMLLVVKYALLAAMLRERH